MDDSNEPKTSQDDTPSITKTKDEDPKVQESNAATTQINDEDADFSDVAQYGIFDICGTDLLGRPVLVVNACKLPTYGEMDFDRFLKYFTHTLDKVVEKEYILIYFHHGLIPGNRPPFSWVREVYMQFSRKYKKNLKMCYIVHPTTLIRIIINLLRPLISVKFGKKIRYVNHLRGITDVVELTQIRIPSMVIEHDKATDHKKGVAVEYENGASENSS